MECCIKSANKQMAAFIAALLSFIAQVLSALIIQDTGYFFGIITFSLCCHALLFHGIRKRKMSYMIPYLVCQIVCAAYVLGETFNYARGLSGDEKISGCFYPDVKKTNSTTSCSTYFWSSKDDFTSYKNDLGNDPYYKNWTQDLSCTECKKPFHSYATLVVVSQVAVLVSFVLTWNIVLRYVLFLRAEKLRERALAPRVSYFNQGMAQADVVPENPPRPENAPPLYSEKPFQTLDVNGLPVLDQREDRTNSLPPYEETPVMITTPASTINNSAYESQHAAIPPSDISYSVTPSVISDNSQYNNPPGNQNIQPIRPVTIDDLL